MIEEACDALIAAGFVVVRIRCAFAQRARHISTDPGLNQKLSALEQRAPSRPAACTYEAFAAPP